MSVDSVILIKLSADENPDFSFFSAEVSIVFWNLDFMIKNDRVLKISHHKFDNHRHGVDR